MTSYPSDAAIARGEKCLSPNWFFDLSRTPYRALFERRRYVWEVLRHLENYVRDNARAEVRGQVSPGAWVVGEVYVGDGTRIEPGAVVLGPAIIGEGCEIRSHAYIRPFVVIGDDSVVGHACEIKSSFLFPECEVPHFAYVGDSILGRDVNLGAGTKLSNLKVIGQTVTVTVGGRTIDTGRRKLGAILGDGVETGCNSVLSPGALLGKGCIAYPCMHVRGYHPAGSILKLRQGEEIARRG